jgi:hypothetical protein
MMHRFLRLLAIAITFLVSAQAMPTFAETGLLDGKVFVADAGEKGKPADEKNDVITFQDGTFHSSVCDQWGYGKGQYKAVAEGDMINFETETLSPKDGRLVWKGTVKGDTIEGLFTHYRKPTWWRKNPVPIEHWLKGKLKQ